jgi:hypothetical protein
VRPPENAVWGRPSAATAWHIDFKIEWVYRRDSGVRRPVAELGVVVDGIPYLAPAIRDRNRSRCYVVTTGKAIPPPGEMSFSFLLRVFRGRQVSNS